MNFEEKLAQYQKDNPDKSLVEAIEAVLFSVWQASEEEAAPVLEQAAKMIAKAKSSSVRKENGVSMDAAINAYVQEIQKAAASKGKKMSYTEALTYVDKTLQREWLMAKGNK